MALTRKHGEGFQTAVLGLTENKIQIYPNDIYTLRKLKRIISKRNPRFEGTILRLQAQDEMDPQPSSYPIIGSTTRLKEWCGDETTINSMVLWNTGQNSAFFGVSRVSKVSINGYV